MPTSRTCPTKLATAPITGLFFRIASVSTVRSKSSRWTETFNSSPRHRRKEGHLVAGLDRRDGLDHFLVHRRADAALLGERLRPGAAARTQLRAPGRDPGT